MHQTYADRSLYILDDSDDGSPPLTDLLEGIPRVHYERSSVRIPLGEKRNRLLAKAWADGHEYAAFFDDDDYGFADRIRKAVITLRGNPKINIVGTSAMLMYNGSTLKLVGPWTGPFGPNHATAGTWVMRKAIMLDTPGFDPAAGKAEEARFLNGFRTPLKQMDPFDVIIVMGHGANTSSKDRFFTGSKAADGLDIRALLRKDKAGLEVIASCFK